MVDMDLVGVEVQDFGWSLWRTFSLDWRGWVRIVTAVPLISLIVLLLLLLLALDGRGEEMSALIELLVRV
jgi:hypothetical protein